MQTVRLYHAVTPQGHSMCVVTASVDNRTWMDESDDYVDTGIEVDVPPLDRAEAVKKATAQLDKQAAELQDKLQIILRAKQELLAIGSDGHEDNS